MTAPKPRRALAAHARRILLALVALVLGLNLYLWNARSFGRNALPMPFGYGVSVILSGSMEPTLHVNELALIRATQQVAVGDVIVYQSGDSLIIHRVIAIDGDTVTTQGDANSAPDAPISHTVIRGKLVAHLPGAGAVVRLLKQPWMVLLLLAAAAALVELSYRRERQQDTAQTQALRAEIARLRQLQERGGAEDEGTRQGDQ